MRAREDAERSLRDEAERLTRHAGASWRAGYGDGFHDGLAWAVEETDEGIESLTRAMYERGADHDRLPPWDDVPELQRWAWRDDVRAVLAALRDKQQS